MNREVLSNCFFLFAFTGTHDAFGYYGIIQSKFSVLVQLSTLHMKYAYDKLVPYCNFAFICSIKNDFVCQCAACQHSSRGRISLPMYSSDVIRRWYARETQHHQYQGRTHEIFKVFLTFVFLQLYNLFVNKISRQNLCKIIMLNPCF